MRIKSIFFIFFAMSSILYSVDVQTMIQIKPTEAVSNIAGNDDLLVVSLTHRESHNLTKELADPTTELLIYSNLNLYKKVNIGTGVVRASIRINRGQVIARILPDSTSYERVEFVLVDLDGNILELPSLETILVGLVETPCGELMAYSYREAWILRGNEWRSLGLEDYLDGEVIKAILINNNEYLISTREQLRIYKDLDQPPVWKVTSDIADINLVGEEFVGLNQAGDLVTIQPLNNSIEKIYASDFDGSIVLSSTSNKESIGFLVTKKLKKYNATRTCSVFNMEGKKVEREDYELPDKTTHLILINEYLIGATSSGLVYKLKL